MAEIFRGPLIAPRRDKPARVPSFDPPNILLSVLVATTPFFPQQWPNPAAKPRYVHREFDAQNLILSTLVPISATTPFGSVDTPRIQRAKPSAASFDPQNLILSTLVPVTPAADVIFREVALSRSSWRLSKAVGSDPPNLLGTTLVPVAGPAPFFPETWDLVYKRPPKVAQFDPPNILTAELVLTNPFFEPQWPSAARAKAKVSPFDPPNTLLAELVVTLPFQAYVMGNWPNAYKRLPRAAQFDSPFPFQVLPPPPPPVSPPCVDQVISIMSNGPWPAQGAMSNLPIGVEADIC